MGNHLGHVGLEVAERLPIPPRDLSGFEVAVARPDVRPEHESIWELLDQLLPLRLKRGGAELSDAHVVGVESAAEQVHQIVAEIGGPDSPRPIASAASDWISFSGGCYSGIFSEDASESDFAVLAEPAGRMLFAGEATSPDSYASVDGAWLTGVREAMRLLQVPEVPIL